MSILVQTPDGFLLHVERAEKSLLTSPAANTLDLSAIKPGRRCPVSAPNRATLIRNLLAIWSNGAVPLLLSDAQGLEDDGSPSVAGGFDPLSASPGQRVLEFSPEDALCELFTSGSTGAPQSFEKCARQIFGEAVVLREILELSPSDVVLATTASHHLYGLLFGVLAPWAGGASIVASPENEPGTFHPEKIAALAWQHQATHLISVPAHLRALLQAPVQLPTVRTIVSSAAPLSAADAQKLDEKFGARVLDVLGSTETGGLATRRASAPAIWTPLPGVRVRLDEDNRLLISSPFVSDPSREEISEERAQVHKDGTFEYLGRADSVVKVGGKRIDLQEIEHLIRRLPSVTDCACLSRSVESLRGEDVLLVVATTKHSKGQIRAALVGSIDRTFLPRKIRIVEKLSRDERGKLKRADLLRLFEEPTESRERAEKSVHVPADWGRFSGHFDGDPLLPALSQLADIILPAIREAFGGGPLASLRRVKWTQAIRPGAELALCLEKKPQGITFQLWEGQVLACSGTATLQKGGS